MATDFSAPIFGTHRRDVGIIGRLAVEWLNTWGEVCRNEAWIPELDAKERGGRTSRLIRPAGLTAAQCMYLDVEVTIGSAEIIRQVLSWRYIQKAELKYLNADPELARLVIASGLPIVGYWRIIHESFCRRLVRDRGLNCGPCRLILHKRETARKLEQVAV